MVGPSRRREAVDHAQERTDTSQRRACKTLKQPRSTQRYRPTRASDEPRLIKDIHEIVRAYPRYGTPRVTHELRLLGWRVNHKRVERLWRKEGLKVPKKPKKKRRFGASTNGIMHVQAASPNDVWTWDFVFDRLENGRQVKWLSLVDEFTRENLLLIASHSITARDVISFIGDIIDERGAPAAIRSDNGPEFIAKALREWLEQCGIGTLYIEPGAPWENGFAESFHSRLRDEFLGTEIFTSLLEAQVLTRDWRDHYNRRRPHSSLDYLSPEQFARKWYEENIEGENTGPRNFPPPRGRKGMGLPPSQTTRGSCEMPSVAKWPQTSHHFPLPRHRSSPYVLYNAHSLDLSPPLAALWFFEILPQGRPPRRHVAFRFPLSPVSNCIFRGGT